MLSDCQNLNRLTGYHGRRERSRLKIYDGNVPGWRDFAHAQRAVWSLTEGHTLFCQVTPFIFIVAPKKLYSEYTSRYQGFQICEKNFAATHRSRDTAHAQRRSGCKRIVNGILWEMSELITQERIAAGSSNLVEGLIT